MNELLEYARSFLGVPYKYGGKCAVSGIDCSGLVSEILRSVGVVGNHDELNAQALFDRFEKTGRQNVWGPGSLAFYGESVTKVDHVAFCLDQYRMIEAGGGDHLTLTRDDANAKNALVRERLIKFRADFLCVIKPDYSSIGIV